MNEMMEKIISLAKRRGFIFQGSDIYGGLAGTWDFGPLGVELKNTIKRLWWERFVTRRSDMYGVESAILMNSKVWEASGHAKNFSDPMVDCKKCKRRFRADKVLENFFIENPTIIHKNNLPDLLSLSRDFQSFKTLMKCEYCGELNTLSDPRQFNMMFKTHAGPVEDAGSEVYLRPETAQGMFTNFKNVIDAFHPKLPFGIAQIGKAFRNEITPGNFIFRSREFEQMEIEYFVRENEWEKHFEEWLALMVGWIEALGLTKTHTREVSKDALAHYSKRTVDIDYDFPFGREELYGIAYRTDFDLKNHSEGSMLDLSYTEDEGTKYVPHVIEPTFGVERTILALLSEAYKEETLEKNDSRTVLRFKSYLAPVTVAVFPLVSNREPIMEKATNVYHGLKSQFKTVFDGIGNVGKRYRRQDEIGTPWCVTIDYQTLEDDTVTVRDRDTMKQDRVAISELQSYICEKLSYV